MTNTVTQVQDVNEMGELTLCVNGVHIVVYTKVDEYYKESQPWRGGTNPRLVARTLGLCDKSHCWHITEDIAKLANRFKSAMVEEEVNIDDLPRRADEPTDDPAIS